MMLTTACREFPVVADTMIMREAQREDLKGILALYSQLNPDDPDVTDGRDAVVFDKILDNEHLTVFVGVTDRVMATCYLNVIPNLSRNVSPYGIIENVVIDEQYRNRGFGKQIMAHALDAAWAAGCYKVMLQTGSRQASTHQFYKSCGFDASEKFAFVARP